MRYGGEMWGGNVYGELTAAGANTAGGAGAAAGGGDGLSCPEIVRGDPRSPRLQALRWAAETSVQTLSQPLLLAAAPPPPAGYAAGHTAGYVAAAPPHSQHSQYSQHSQHSLAAAGYGAAAVAPLSTGGYDVGGGEYGGVAPAGYGHGYNHGYSHAGAPGAGW